MNTAPAIAARECAAALSAHLERGSESTLHAGYEVGRRALAAGLGVVEMAATCGAALVTALQDDRVDPRCVAIVSAANQLAVEVLSPFEMGYRGAREANDALRRMNELREEEIRRVAHELHDTAGQLLATALLALARAEQDTPHARRRALAEVRDLLQRTDAALRRLAHETRPPVLDDLGIGAALRLLCDGVGRRAGIVVEARIEIDERPPAAVEIALYRIAQEALRNVLKHAAASRVVVALGSDERTIELRIRDDGVGFESGAPRAGSGLGLLGIRERVVTLEGTLRIESRPGGGTDLVVSIPREAPCAVPRSAGG
jgi:signal transduction histidine kinase